MRLLFIHDHPFYREMKSEIIYSGGGLPKNIWNNYLINFEEVFVYGRQSTNLKNKKVESSAKNVSFYLTRYYSSPLNLIKNKKNIEKELERLIDQVEVVLIRLPSVLGFIAGNIAMKKNKTLWVEQVGNAKEALGSYGSFLGTIAAPFFECQNKKLVNIADFVSYVTENKLQKDYPANSKSVTVSVSNVIINSITEEKDLNQNRFFNELFRIGLIGGFDVRYKGQDILLKAISLFEEDIRENIKISFVGKGDYSWIVEQAKALQLENNIEYLGSLESGNQINDFLKTLSLYVQPSLTEGMPRATIEAMAMGCPIIGSNVGGIPDIVSEKLVHKKANFKELHEHIKYLYFNREVLNKEAITSLKKASPYLKNNLDMKRLAFYNEMNILLNAK